MIDKKKFLPLISIYMPTYNRNNLLKRAIDSVLEQTYSNFELIIVDDGSSDKTHSLLEKYAATDCRIRWFIKPSNIPRGACASRNIAISKANGRFITGIDDDDYFCPHRLMDFIEHWRDDLLGLYSNITNEKKGIRREIRRPRTTSSKELLEKNVITHLFVELETLKKSSGFDEAFQIWQDFELWFRLLRNSTGEVANTGTASYIVCADNTHYRISHKRAYTVKKTYIQFCLKHELSRQEKLILLVHVFKYFPHLMPWKYWLSIFCVGMSPVFFEEVSKISVKKIFTRKLP